MTGKIINFENRLKFQKKFSKTKGAQKFVEDIAQFG